MQVNTTATCCYHIVLDCRGLARPFFVTLAGANLTFQVGQCRLAVRFMHFDAGG